MQYFSVSLGELCPVKLGERVSMHAALGAACSEAVAPTVTIRLAPIMRHDVACKRIRKGRSGMPGAFDDQPGTPRLPLSSALDSSTGKTCIFSLDA